MTFTKPFITEHQITHFSPLYMEYSQIDRMLGLKRNLNKLKIEIMPNIMLNYNDLKLEINCKKKARRLTNMWRLNSMLLNQPTESKK